jgi:hypothetical protein
VDAIDNGAAIVAEAYVSGTVGDSRLLGDTGHNFDHKFRQVITDTPFANLQIKGQPQFYRGPILISPSAVEQGLPSGGGDGFAYNPTWITQSQLQNLGSGLVNRASPLAMQNNLLQSLIELLREGIPAALFSALVAPKSASKAGLIRSLGGEYLGHMFGLVPLVRDIDNIIKTTKSMDMLIAQLIKDDGVAIYRKRSLPTVETNYPIVRRTNGRFDLMVPGKGGISTPSTGFSVDRVLVNGYVNAEHSTRDTRDVCFSGSFTYYLENLRRPTFVSDFFDSIEGVGPSKMQDILKQYLIGIGEGNVSSALWWQLSPFSWLVDWFVNVGTVLDNRRMFDELGLVMNFGYVMCREERSTTSVIRTSDGRTFSSQHRSIRQRRERASPFGFGIDPGKLSTYQVSILGALATQLLPRGR